jgi:hypothetical protein
MNKKILVFFGTVLAIIGILFAYYANKLSLTQTISESITKFESTIIILTGYVLIAIGWGASKKQ